MVIDASVAAAWFLTTQATSRADALLANRQNHTFVAPIYFAVELRNVLLLGERRGTITATKATENILMASALIDIAKGDMHEEAQRAMAVARRSGLKLYDAIYLEKAMREGRALASRDRTLLETAAAAGVEVYDARL